MPAETNQRGRSVDSGNVLDLLLSLLGDPHLTTPDSTLASLGIDDEDLACMWDAVCEEFAERSLGPELEQETLQETLQTSMTLATAAAALAALLGEDHRGE